MTLKNFTGLDASNEILLVETILRLLLAISLGHLKELSKGFIKPLANVLQRTFPVWKGPTALCDRVRALQFCARVPAEWTKFQASLSSAGLTRSEIAWMKSLFLEGRLPLQRLVGENSEPFDERNLPTSKTTAIESNSKTKFLNVDWNMTATKPSLAVFSPALLSSGPANVDWNSEASEGKVLQFLAPKQIRINVMFVGKQPKWFTRFIPCPCVRRSLTSPWVNPAIPYLQEAAILNLFDALRELNAHIEVQDLPRNCWEKAIKYKLNLPSADNRQHLPYNARMAINVFEGTLDHLPEFVIVERKATQNGDINFNIKLPVIRYYPDAEEAEPAEEEAEEADNNEPADESDLDEHGPANQCEVDENESANQCEVDENESADQCEMDEDESANQIQVDENESADQCEMDEDESANQIQVDENEPADQCEIDENESANQIEVDENEPANQCEMDENEPADEEPEIDLTGGIWAEYARISRI